MKRKRRRKFREERAIELTKTFKPAEKNAGVSRWPGAEWRFATVIGIALIVAFTLGIYVQTVRVPPIDYEDSYYLLHNPYVNLTSAFARLGAVWNEPYFANTPLQPPLGSSIAPWLTRGCPSMGCRFASLSYSIQSSPRRC